MDTVKQGLSPKGLILSLIFPVLTLLPCSALAAVLFLDRMPFSGMFLGWWIPSIAGILCGGVLPIVLTAVTKTDTSGYLLKRCVILAAMAAYYVGAFLIIAWINEVSDFVIAVFAIAPLIVSAVYHIRKAGKHTEWIIICLSDPVLYFVIWYICTLLMINGVIA